MVRVGQYRGKIRGNLMHIVNFLLGFAKEERGGALERNSGDNSYHTHTNGSCLKQLSEPMQKKLSAHKINRSRGQ